MCPRDFPFPLQEQFDEIPPENKKKNEEQKEDDYLKRCQERSGHSRGRKLLGFTNKELDGEEKDYEENDDCAYDARALLF